ELEKDRDEAKSQISVTNDRWAAAFRDAHDRWAAERQALQQQMQQLQAAGAGQPDYARLRAENLFLQEQLPSACQRFAEEHRARGEEVERIRKEGEATKHERDNALMKVQKLQQEAWQQKQLWEEERQHLVLKWQQAKKERAREAAARAQQEDSKT